MAGLASMGSWAFRAAPRFWNHVSEDQARTVFPAPAHPAPRSWSDRGLHAAWLGHTTVLLKIDGVTILTDPVLSTRVGINLGLFTLGLKRVVEPALAVEGLPKIDVVLLSHAHFDHFDLPTLRRLESRVTAVVTAAKTADLLRVNRYRKVDELGWGGRTSIGPLEIRAFPVKHWGARMRSDTYRGYNGYTIEAGRYRVVFGGDTASTTTFRPLKSARPFDLAVMPVGAYNPWIYSHCTPEQAWQMADDAGSEFFLPVHHQTFPLSREPYLEPIERVYQAAGANPERVALHQIGQEFHFLA
ncbi:MAG TPA: MBL fold metallo-hydrolase [Bryobacteraceae bacterium]|nr:MBL fold metallo-hydrolase [Bryobacteraceae bacterium]